MKTLAEQNKAMKILHDRFLPFLVSEVMKSAQIHEPPHEIERERAPKVYRVSVEEISKVRETKLNILCCAINQNSNNYRF